ncbi:MAG: hypothetical protein KJ970_12040 [Candidatus Eisenbacteria bacterium]|uniref:Uncharacterized protein n=1 Tax=Eiseniibacteriota bacterium TaxID=2212470 RepID=A0A948RYU4_UNCEI|nr:hypothetical protein [Candidatus Eisenbacteria bacterium]MBU1947553.1 hypothetical protein [Candidatus Eisenbacteria bacterium]MBU2691647.1 hypothetical protein [Candidatus Eisenbacteria bacterium]
MRKSEHAISIAKAASNLIPFVGGPISSLIGDYLLTTTQKAIDQTLEYLKERVESLEERLDSDVVDKDEFVELFKSCYLIIVRTHQEAKLRGAANLLANMFLKSGDGEKMDYTEIDHFVRCLESLSIGSVKILGQANKLAKMSNRQAATTTPTRITFEELNKEVLPMAPSLLMGLIGELNAFNLLHIPGAPAIREPGYQNYSIEIPPLGRRFVEYVLGEVDQK